jgi:Cft2 family RNA processing exonuclease
MTDELDEAKRCEIHLLDVGKDEYGDAVLCRFGSRTVMIDGAHPGDHDGTPGHLSIPQQIETLLEKNAPYPIDLLIISHAHQDHIGCLPKLIADNKLKVGWILAIDPKLGWGRTGNEDSFRDADPNVLKLSAALREEIHSERGTQDAAMERFLSDATNLETRYQQMLTTLEQSGTKVVRFGNQ